MTNPGGDAQSLYRLPLYQQLQVAICSYIAENGLRAGDPIPAEGVLAERFGVGRNSVREAVKSLQVMGVLVSRPGLGLFVREFSFAPIVESLPYAAIVGHSDLDNLLEVRRLLEVGMARRVLEASTDAQIANLHEIVDSWRQETDKPPHVYPAHLDRSFHDELLSEVQNELVGTLLDTFWQVFYRASQRHELDPPLDSVATLSYHVDILNALEHGDSKALEGSLMAHYEGIGRRVNKAGTKRGNNEVTGSEVVPVDKRGQAPRRPQSNRRSEESK